MSLLKKVYLRRGKEESLKRFHPWIFSGAVERMDDGIEEGDIVDVITSGGDFIARGHFQRGSIMVRVLTFNDEPIDEGYWQERLRVAYDVRKKIGFGSQTTAYRLVHGEGDCLPGLVIDIYGKTAVMQAHSIGMHVCRLEIGRALGRGGKRIPLWRDKRRHRSRERTEIPCRLAAWSEDRLLCGPA